MYEGGIIFETTYPILNTLLLVKTNIQAYSIDKNFCSYLHVF